MSTKLRISILVLIIILLGGVVTFCNGHKEAKKEEVGELHLKDSGQLTVITMYSSTSYFLYRGQEMGFQYELAQQFAQSLGVKLKIKTAANVQEMVEMLCKGEGDLIAYNLPIHQNWKDSVIYCGEEVVTHQVIVQRSGGKSLKDVTELIGKEIEVNPGKYLQRLENLNAELGGGITIHSIPTDSLTSEELIAQVALGKTAYTVADNDIARLNRTYYPNLDISLAISFDQRASWAVSSNNPLLAEAANKWHEENATSPAYGASIKRYFEQSKMKIHSPILSIRDGKISHFDALFKKYSKEIGWDWRLMASLAYTESNFDTTAVSWAGARGLMQLMPATARKMGIKKGKETNAEESVRAAAKYIHLVNQGLQSIQNKEERIYFILGAYNAGLGHITDAMALAKKHGSNPHIWHNHVEKYILLKSNEQYFTDPVCRYGYFRGNETFQFVRDIVQRYHLYQTQIK